MGLSAQCYIPVPSFKVIGLSVLEKKTFEEFLPYMGMVAILVKWPRPSEQTMVPLSRWSSIWNMASIDPSGLWEDVWKCWWVTESQWPCTKVKEWPWPLTTKYPKWPDEDIMSLKVKVIPSDHPSLRFSNIFSSETTGPIEAKFHMESQWDGGTKDFTRGLGDMTKMSAMPIYGRNPSKIFFSRTKRTMTLKLGMYHRACRPNIVYTNDDLALTLTSFTAWSTLVR